MKYILFIVALLADGEWSSIEPRLYDTRAQCEAKLEDTRSRGLKGVWRPVGAKPVVWKGWCLEFELPGLV